VAPQALAPAHSQVQYKCSSFLLRHVSVHAWSLVWESALFMLARRSLILKLGRRADGSMVPGAPVISRVGGIGGGGLRASTRATSTTSMSTSTGAMGRAMLERAS